MESFQIGISSVNKAKDPFDNTSFNPVIDPPLLSKIYKKLIFLHLSWHIYEILSKLVFVLEKLIAHIILAHIILVMGKETRQLMVCASNVDIFVLLPLLSPAP